MTTLNFAPPYNDEAIVAWLDGEMSSADAEHFEQRLISDEQLAARTDELMKSHCGIAEVFAPLLDDAPQSRMQARLETLLAKPRVPSATRGISRRSLIAASLSFLIIGSGLGFLARNPPNDDDDGETIRTLEAQYMSLYSAETLLDMDSSSAMLARGLARTAQDIGLTLTEEQLVVSGAELKMVRMLRYDSTSIAQIAWMHAEYGPMALCISPQRSGNRSDIAHEKRHGMHIAWWQHGGYQFVLIGRNPVADMADSARRLQSALS